MMPYETKRWVQRCARAALVMAVAFSSAVVLGSCAPEAPAARPSSAVRAPAGDEALPPLDGSFAYVQARVLSKDAESDSLTVEALAWDSDDGFNAATIVAGETGAVSCSELVLFPAGIREGTVVAVACPLDEADAFPITAYSIEKLDWFEDRLARRHGA